MTIEPPSPNHDERPAGRDVDMLVLHYTGMASAGEALARLCDPAAKVSSHYLIDEDGGVTRLVDEERRAWHAGTAYWRGARDINDRSIGIELVNPGHEFGYRPFPPAQMKALIQLIRDILARHPIPPRNVVGHADIAPTRKQDPGELFDWGMLGRAGIGLWPRFDRPQEEELEHDLPLDEVQALLGTIGYEVPVSGRYDHMTRAAIAAFQRHYRPSRCDGNLDRETVRRLELVVSLVI